MSERTVASYTIELARRFDGYLVQLDQTIVDLRDLGLITTKYAGDGFVIARAVPQPAPPGPRTPRGRWRRRHPIGSFPRIEAKRGASL